MDMPHSPFDENIDRRHTFSLKWDRYADRDIIPLWVADMDFRSPPAVIEALRRRIAHEVFGYTRPNPSLNEAVVAYFQRAHGVTVDPDWIVWLPGCVPALSMACGAAGNPGDQVLTCTPVYPPFLHVHRDSERQCQTVPLVTNAEGQYQMDMNALEAAVTRTTRVFLFCNPHNPVGRVYSRAEVEAVAKFCARHDLLLCSDEIHCDLILDEAARHVPVLALPQELCAGTITLMAASKTYNIAGLACALAVIPDASLRRRFIRSGGKRIPEISPLGFVATEAAYREGEPWRQELLAYLRGNYHAISRFVTSEIAEISMTPLQASYLAWLDVRKLGLERPSDYFEQHGLGFSDGRDFGAPGFLRMNFACPRALLETALQRLKDAVCRSERSEGPASY